VVGGRSSFILTLKTTTMKRYIKYMMLAIIGIAWSCDSFVEVDVPPSQLTGDIVYDNPATANAAVANLYSKLRDTGILTGLSTGGSVSMGLYADELIYYGSDDENSTTLINNGLLPTSALPGQYWNDGYHQIYCANAIIEGVGNSVTLPQETKDNLTGEAKFVRALVHFYLMDIYGDIPYVTTTDYEVNRLVARMPINEVYDRVIADLEAAITLLPEADTSGERVKPNNAVAQALLARVYLYAGLWGEAANEASAVLNSPAYALEADPANVFLNTSTETIWQFKPGMDGANADEGSVFIYFTGPPPSVALDSQLVAAFEPGDLRKDEWVGTVTDGSDTWYYANKYKQNGPTGSSVEYSVVLRLAEQYLIRAEARAMQGDLIGAKEDLDVVRSRAGLPNSTAVTTEELQMAILQERRVEFFTEYGHRFFDLKRTGNIDAVLSAKPGWNPSDVLWPLPETEMLANPNLTPQNPGY
jgi:hypothetical protein